jgi:hypothetical protein
LSVGYALLLQTVTMSNTALSWHKMLRLSEVLGKATVSDLHLNFESEKVSGGLVLLTKHVIFSGYEKVL